RARSSWRPRGTRGGRERGPGAWGRLRLGDPGVHEPSASLAGPVKNLEYREVRSGDPPRQRGRGYATSHVRARGRTWAGRVAPRLWAIAPARSRADRTGRRGRPLAR